MLGAVGGDPAVQRDDADDRRPASPRARFNSAHAAALLEVGGDLVVPGLDRGITRLAGEPDLLQQGVGRIVLVLRQYWNSLIVLASR